MVVSDSLILPFNALTYAKQIEREFELFNRTYETQLTELDMDIKLFQTAVELFVQEAERFHQRLATVDRNK